MKKFFIFLALLLSGELQSSPTLTIKNRLSDQGSQSILEYVIIPQGNATNPAGPVPPGQSITTELSYTSSSGWKRFDGTIELSWGYPSPGPSGQFTQGCCHPFHYDGWSATGTYWKVDDPVTSTYCPYATCDKVSFIQDDSGKLIITVGP